MAAIDLDAVERAEVFGSAVIPAGVNRTADGVVFICFFCIHENSPFFKSADFSASIVYGATTKIWGVKFEQPDYGKMLRTFRA